MVQLSHLYMMIGKTIALTIWTFVGKWMSLFFNTLSRSVIAFLPRSSLLISWLQSPSTVILEPKKRKSVTVCIFPPSISHKADAMILVFWMLSFKPAFSLSSFTLINKLFDSSSLSALEWYHHCFSLLFFPQLSVWKPSQTTTLPSCIFFPLGWFWSLPPVQRYEPFSHSFSGSLSTRLDLITWIYLSLPLYNHKGFDLGHTWMA